MVTYRLPHENAETCGEMHVPTVDPKRWYTAREAGGYLDVTAETIKVYCRIKKMKAQRFGPKKEWRVLGSEISKKASEWGLDQLGKGT